MVLSFVCAAKSFVQKTVGVLAAGAAAGELADAPKSFDLGVPYVLAISISLGMHARGDFYERLSGSEAP
jgi:hypothetical protein